MPGSRGDAYFASIRLSHHHIIQRSRAECGRGDASPLLLGRESLPLSQFGFRLAWEPQSKLRKGDYIGDYIGDCYRGDKAGRAEWQNTSGRATVVGVDIRHILIPTYIETGYCQVCPEATVWLLPLLLLPLLLLRVLLLLTTIHRSKA